MTDTNNSNMDGIKNNLSKTHGDLDDIMAVEQTEIQHKQSFASHSTSYSIYQFRRKLPYYLHIQINGILANELFTDFDRFQCGLFECALKSPIDVINFDAFYRVMAFFL